MNNKEFIEQDNILGFFRVLGIMEKVKIKEERVDEMGNNQDVILPFLCDPGSIPREDKTKPGIKKSKKYVWYRLVL